MASDEGEARKCIACGHEWFFRYDSFPAVCPVCKSTRTFFNRMPWRNISRL